MRIWGAKALLKTAGKCLFNRYKDRNIIFGMCVWTGKRRVDIDGSIAKALQESIFLPFGFEGTERLFFKVEEPFKDRKQLLEYHRAS